MDADGTRKGSETNRYTRLQNHLSTITGLMRAPISPAQQSESNLEGCTEGEQRVIMAAARRLYDHRPCLHKTVLEAFCQVPVACDQRATALATKSLKDVHFQARRAVVQQVPPSMAVSREERTIIVFDLQHGAVIKAAASLTALTLGWASEIALVSVTSRTQVTYSAIVMVLGTHILFRSALQEFFHDRDPKKHVVAAENTLEMQRRCRDEQASAKENKGIEASGTGASVGKYSVWKRLAPWDVEQWSWCEDSTKLDTPWTREKVSFAELWTSQNVRKRTPVEHGLGCQSATSVVFFSANKG